MILKKEFYISRMKHMYSVRYVNDYFNLKYLKFKLSSQTTVKHIFKLSFVVFKFRL